MQQADRLRSVPPYPFAEIARLKEQAAKEGWDVIDFGIGDPDIPPPGCVLRAMEEALHQPELHQYDESSWGLAEFREAVAQWFGERFGVSLDPDGGVKVTVGSKEALAHAAWAFLDPGDVSLIPDPGYGVYAANSRFAGAEAYPMPLVSENGFLPDLDAIPASVANRAKLLFLNYPNNPTGKSAPPEFLRKAVEFAEKYDVLVCHDAAYSEVYFTDAPPHSILEAEGAMERAVEFHSCSKTYGMTGWRIGWVCGSKGGVAGVSKMKSFIDSNVLPAIQKTAAAAMREGGGHAETMRNTYRSRAETLVDGLRSIGWPVDPPDGTLFVWAPTPKGVTSADLSARLLAEAHVVTVPGSAYGACGEGFVRFSLTVRADDVRARIAEGVERIAKLGLTW